MPKFTPEQLKTLPLTQRPGPGDPPTTELYYFTGKPCKHGHVSAHYVSSGNCVECTRRTRPRARLTGAVYCTFPMLSSAVQQDPTLADKIGVILFNDAALIDWLVARARAGENGYGATGQRFEAGPEELHVPHDGKPYEDRATKALHTWGELKAAGWSLAQLAHALQRGELLEW